MPEGTSPPSTEQQTDMPHVRIPLKNLIDTLEVEPSMFHLPTRKLEHFTAMKRHDNKDHWNVKAISVIHSHPVQYILVGLLILDVLILFAELFLSASYPDCTIIERDGISCCPTTAERWLSESAAVCEEPYEATLYPVTCNEHAHHGLHELHNALRITSISILAIFLMELCILILGLGACHFFGNIWYVVDFTVVITSFTLEIIFTLLDDVEAGDLAGLLILARLWRFVRIGHGIVASTIELANQKYEKLVLYAHNCEKVLDENRLALPEGRPDVDEGASS